LALLGCALGIGIGCVPKNRIKFYSTSYPDPKVNFEGFAYGDKKIYNNNINNTASITSLRSSTLKGFSLRGWVVRCLSWMAGRYTATLRRIQSGYVLLRWKEIIKIINISIFFLLGMGFCLYFPSLFSSVTGLTLYNSTDLVYSMSLFEIRKTCAKVFGYLFLYFAIFIQYKLKLSRPILNKPMMGASGIIIKGGFEGLGDPELESQHVSPTMRTFNSKFTEKDEDLLSLALSDARNESLSTNSSTSPPRLNPDVNGVPIPNTPGCKTAGPSTGSRHYFGSLYWYNPTSSPTTPPGTPIEPAIEPATTSEVTKKVRFNNIKEEQVIPKTSSSLNKEWNKELLEMVNENKKQRAIERYNNISYNSDPTDTQTFNSFKGKKKDSNDKDTANLKWDFYYGRELENSQYGRELENSPQIGRSDPHSNILEAIKRSKPSGSLATSNFENIKGHIINPSSSSKLEQWSQLQDFKNKFK
jgi:hypothetical protein